MAADQSLFKLLEVSADINPEPRDGLARALTDILPSTPLGESDDIERRGDINPVRKDEEGGTRVEAAETGHDAITVESDLIKARRSTIKVLGLPDGPSDDDGDGSVSDSTPMLGNRRRRIDRQRKKCRSVVIVVDETSKPGNAVETETSNRYKRILCRIGCCIKQIGRSFVLLCFFGEPRYVNAPSGDDVSHSTYDGMIFSIILFLSLIAGSFSMTIAMFVTINDAEDIYMPDVDCLQSAYMGLGIVSMIFLFVYRKSPTDERLHRTKKSQRHLKTYGFGTLFILSVPLYASSIAAQTSCKRAWMTCELSTAYGTSVAADVLRIAFMGVETLFCSVFAGKNFQRSRLVRLALAVMQAANLSFWFNVVFFDAAEAVTNRTIASIAGLSHACNETIFVGNTSVDAHLRQCAREETAEYNWMRTASLYFSPFNVEFAMLVSESIGHWFFNLQSSSSSTSLPTQSPSPSASRTPRRQVKNSPTDFGSSSRVRPEVALKMDPTATEPLVDATGVNGNDNRNRTHKLWYGVPIAWSLVCALMVIFGGFTYLDRKEDTYLLLFTQFKVAFYVVLLVITVVGSCCVLSNKRNDKPFQGFDFLVLLSTVGFLFYWAFTFFAIVQSIYDDNFPALAKPQLTELIFCFLQLVFQSSFLFIADRVTFRERGQSFKCFRLVLVCLALANGSIWAVDSFVEIKNIHVRTVEVSYYSTSQWNFLQHVLLPIAFFYRFNCMLIFLIVLFNQAKTKIKATTLKSKVKFTTYRAKANKIGLIHKATRKELSRSRPMSQPFRRPIGSISKSFKSRSTGKID